MNVQKQSPEVFYKKSVHKNFTKFTGKHLCQNLFFKKNRKPANLLKKRLRYRGFGVNFAKFLWTPFLQNTSGRLLLNVLKLLLISKLLSQYHIKYLYCTATHYPQSCMPPVIFWHKEPTLVSINLLTLEFIHSVWRLVFWSWTYKSLFSYNFVITDRRQMSLIISSKFQQINYQLFPLRS